VDPGWRQLERRREQRAEDRRHWAGDVVLWAFLTAIAVSVGWGMWRLDDRSERLFAVVAAERSAASRCP
jgi:hypothetical protein